MTVAGCVEAPELMNYTIIDLKQGSPEWLQWRRTGFGSSDIPTIMGENRFQDWETLIAEKRGLVERQMNEVMARGTALEPEARQAYIRKVGVEVAPSGATKTKLES